MDNNVIYIKFSNGSTTMLVNMYNQAAQNEAIENGFLMVTGADGLPETVDSTELLSANDMNREQLLRAIAEKHANKNANMQAKKTLSAKYGR